MRPSRTSASGESSVARYGLFSSYFVTVRVHRGGRIHTHSVGSGSFYLQPGCTVATTTAGTWTNAGTKKAPSIMVTWTAGSDVYSGCDDPANDFSDAFNQDKLAAISGLTTIAMSDEDQEMAMTASAYGQSYTATYERASADDE